MSHRCGVGGVGGSLGCRDKKKKNAALTFRRRGFQSLAKSRHASVVVLDLDDGLSASELHERAQLHQRAAETASAAAAGIVSLVLGVEIAVPHVPHGGGVCVLLEDREERRAEGRPRWRRNA